MIEGRGIVIFTLDNLMAKMSSKGPIKNNCGTGSSISTSVLKGEILSSIWTKPMFTFPMVSIVALTFSSKTDITKGWQLEMVPRRCRPVLEVDSLVWLEMNETCSVTTKKCHQISSKNSIKNFINLLVLNSTFCSTKMTTTMFTSVGKKYPPFPQFNVV